jgi:lipid A disaccharide synthetase
MGYELLNPPGTDWYIIRLRKEYDSASFDYFLKRVGGIDRRHMALLTIIYAELIIPKELSHVNPENELSLTVDELVYKYGVKFQQGKQSMQKSIETLLAPLKRYHYIIFEKGKAKITAGPAMYMLRGDMLMDICDYAIQGLTESLKSIEKIKDEDYAIGEEIIE